MAAAPGKRVRFIDYRYLHNGDRMNQCDFHAAYSQMPENYRAELIGGIVYEPSPLGWQHGEKHANFGSAFACYAGRTKGLQLADNVTVILGEEDEVQPDLVLRVSPKYKGQSGFTKDKRGRDQYVKGAPEMVAEVAHSSRAIDLHFKKERYQLAGVIEYIVLCLEPEKIYWFSLKESCELESDNAGVYRSNVFPGFWIDSTALWQQDYDRLMDTLAIGMKTPEYRQFSSDLAQRTGK